MASSEKAWENHDHGALVHSHRHYHVTHNYQEAGGGFEHLSAAHEHSHDHTAVTHSHRPHERFDDEHAGEAHVHDHAVPVQDGQVQDGQADGGAAKPKKAAARKSAAKAAAPGAS